MRTTKETLLKLAKETVKQRTTDNRSIVAAFLIGSLLGDDPFLGGATDIDLLFITGEETFRAREIVALSAEVHIDLSFEPVKLYEKPRELRADAWRGYALYDLLPLYETRHFFEFTQASVRAQFNDPVNQVARIRQQFIPARKLWADLQSARTVGSDQRVQYLKAIEHAANAAALFSGAPLTVRRLMASFPERARSLGRPELADTLLVLLNAHEVDAAGIQTWLPRWEASFLAAAETKEEDAIHAARLNYYKHAIQHFAKNENPSAALWPLITTWAQADALTALDIDEAGAWREVCRRCGLDKDGMPAHLQALDHFLDVVEEEIEKIAGTNGL
jgi:hypothetical protein